MKSPIKLDQSKILGMSANSVVMAGVKPAGLKPTVEGNKRR